MPVGNWGRWGDDDQSGALNLAGAAEAVAAAGLVRDGRVLSLAQPFGPRTPTPPHRKSIERHMSRDGGDYAAGARRPDGFQFAEEVWSFAAHSGTHVDAMAHAWTDDQLYNGFGSHTVRSTTGAGRCGAEHLTPVVTRGVLVDLAPLGPSEAVGVAALQAALGDVTLQAGDAVLLRTGWLAAMGDDPAYFESEPGIDADAALWLAQHDVALVGADNYAIEVQPSAPGTTFPVHLVLLRDHGVPLIEGLALEELAAAGRPTFMFVFAPLPVVGGTASPICPLAVL